MKVLQCVGALIRKRFRVIVAALVGMAIAAVWLIWPRDGLLGRAVLLIPSRDWVGPERRNGEVANYTWLTNDDILLFQHNRDMSISLLRRKVLPTGSPDTATPLALTPLAKPNAVDISPDRATMHVLYFGRGRPRKGSLNAEFISLRDGRSFHVPVGWSLGQWCEGSPSVCECQFDKKLFATIHYYDGRKDRDVVVNGLADPPVMRGNVWPLFVEASGRVVAVGDSHYSGIVTPALKATLGSKISPVRTFVEFNLYDPNRSGRVWTVPVPEDAATFNCEPAPGHNRLLWIVQSHKMSFLPAITQKLPRPFRQPARYPCRWMVSDLEGHNMHTIARFEVSDLLFSRSDLVRPLWTPDSRHVSFEYKSALYMLPAD